MAWRRPYGRSACAAAANPFDAPPLDAHTKNALAAGATRQELAEVVFIAAALRAGAAVGHGLLAMKQADDSRPGEEAQR